MRNLWLLAALGACACDGKPQQNAAAPVAEMPAEIVQTPVAQSKAPLVVPMPKDQAETDRLILAGYTPHADHLHPPGVKSCPLTDASDAVM